MNTVLQRQYGRDGQLYSCIEQALRDAGKDPEALSPDDLAPVEEFHVRGREATDELAQMAGLRPGMELLDIGCGIGGPARYLARAYGLTVTGIDVCREYCEVARRLSEQVGLADRTMFMQANALELPFKDESFDVVWMQHTNMNIPDKETLFRELSRVLRPGGRLAYYEISANGASSPHYPVPWADRHDISFLAEPEKLKEATEGARFRPLVWEDLTARSLEWAQKLVHRIKEHGPPALSLGTLVGPTMPEKLNNLLRSLEENRIAVVRGVFERS